MNYSNAKKLLFVLVVSVFFISGCFIIRDRFFLDKSTNVTELLDEVGKIVSLPQDEKPTVATITDPKELKGTLFTDSKVGDKLIFYSSSAQAILYRPSDKRIIAIGSLVTK